MFDTCLTEDTCFSVCVPLIQWLNISFLEGITSAESDAQVTERSMAPPRPHDFFAICWYCPFKLSLIRTFSPTAWTLSSVRRWYAKVDYLREKTMLIILTMLNQMLTKAVRNWLQFVSFFQRSDQQSTDVDPVLSHLTHNYPIALKPSCSIEEIHAWLKTASAIGTSSKWRRNES